LLAPALLIDFNSTEIPVIETPTVVEVETAQFPTNGIAVNTAEKFILPPIVEVVEEELQYPEPRIEEFEVVEYRTELIASDIGCGTKVRHDHWTCDGSCGVTQYIERLYAPLIDPEAKNAEVEGRVMDVEEPLFVDYEVNAYPNPFRDQATVEITNYDGDPYTFALYDLSGKLVEMQENQIAQKITVQRGDMAPGIYIYRIVNQSQTNIKSGKLIAQ